MKHFTIAFLVLFGLINLTFSQVKTLKPVKTSQPEAFMTTIPFEEMEFVPATGKTDWKNGVIPNKTFIPPNMGKSTLEQKNSTPDGALQKGYNVTGSNPEAIGQNFDGIYNTYGVAPPDTDGDVGLNHYIQMVNNGFQIFDKSGVALTTPADLSTIWQNLPGPWVGNYGDPIVLYDEIADRWFLSQFSLPNFPNGPFYILIAVSQNFDPLGAYHLYVYSFTDMPDYPKFGVWPDGYYMSINNFAAGTTSWAGAGAAAFERAEMLNGNTADMVLFNFSNTDDPWSFLPADVDGVQPPVGAPNYFTYLDYWSGTDRLRTYEFDVNWTVPANSTFTGPYNINVASFNATASDVPQSGTTQTLDVLDDRLMNRLQYRNFGTYQTLVTNHTVDAGSGRAGVRWYELRKTTGNWYMYQQGTYAPNDGLYRWMGSAAMNGNGDLAIGYSVSGSTMFPAIRYTGRNAGDPLGQMTISEENIFAGPAAQTGVDRWGDYSAMSVDPSDNNTFWYTQEYSGGGWNWRTRIASFNFDPPVLTAQFEGTPNPVIVGNSVTFTDMSIGSPTNWDWSFPGGTPSSFSGQNPPPIIYNTSGFYSVSLTVGDGIDTHTETKSNYINVTNCNYCATSFTNTSDEWISNVTFNTINNTSVSTTYSDFTSISTDVIPGSSYDISVDISVISTYVEHCIVFIDWNQNCDFTDVGESYDLGQVTGPGTLISNISVPADALNGPTRMRVSMRWNVNPTGCDVTTYGEAEDYTLNVGTIGIYCSVFLEGPFNGTDMDANLVSQLPLSQPFNITPWNYAGSESVGTIPSPDVVDWVLIELRDAANAASATESTIIARKAAFLLSYGSVVGMDGSSDLEFNVSVSQNLFVVVWHRNHLGIMSNYPFTQYGTVYGYDYSNGVDQVYGGVNGHKQIATGIWGMIGGDGNHNEQIDSGDKSSSWETEAGKNGYLFNDYNLDGEANNQDKDDIWVPNEGKSSQVPN